MNYNLFIILFFVCLVNKTKAQSYLEFVENKGQWANNIAYKGELNAGAIVLKTDGGYRMLQHNVQDLDAIHNYYHPHEKKETNNQKTTAQLGLHSHVYEISFVGCNPTPQAIAEKPQDTYNNYFIDNDKSKWASGCKIYQAVTYKNIYPNIDIRYYTGNGNLKYDFIVHRGGNPNLIAMVFDGADKLELKKKQLIITTTVSQTTELAPYTFQPTENGKKQINCSYHLNQNIVTFNVGDYDTTQTLIIDPVISFSTFTGSKADNWGFTATYDNAGNFYAGGIVFNDIANGFPVSNGSVFQGGFDNNEDGGKGFDIGIIKFNATGNVKMYATYIGGRGNEQPHSMVCNKNGDLIIVGRTNSPNYPSTFPLAGVGGGRDIIITKLDNAGSIVASRVIGGSDDDGMNIKPKEVSNAGTETINRNYGDDARSEVILDDAENILLASCTQSSNFFTTANAFQKVNAGVGTTMQRKQDAVFIRLTPDMSSILTSTYLGGSNDDAAFVLAINPITKNIYLAGGTVSNDFPGNKTNVIGSSYNGGDCDGFIAMLNSDGTQLLKSSYFGTTGGENIYGIQFDKLGFPYFMGTTTSDNWTVINANYFNAKGKQFIGKIKSDLSAYIYSTTFGTVTHNSAFPNISPTAFLVDRCENVYVSGWGGSIEGIGGYQSGFISDMPFINTTPHKNPTDGSDFYFFVLERGARSQMYGDWFGQFENGSLQEHVDGGTSRFDKEGIIYQSICANCNGNATTTSPRIFPTTPGAYSETNKAADRCNLAAVKIAFNLSGVGAGVKSSIKNVTSDTVGCVPTLIKFYDTLAQGISYTWNFGDGSPIGTTKKADTSHIFTAVGTYNVCVTSTDSSTCNIYETSCKNVIISQDSAHLNLTHKKIGNCIDNMYEFNNTATTFPALKPPTSTSFSIYFGDNTPVQKIGLGIITHQYPIPKTYYGYMALIDSKYCNTPDTVYFEIEVIINVKAQFTPPPKACISKPVQFSNQSSGGKSFIWYFGDGASSLEENPTHLYTATGTYTVTLFAMNPNSCNKKDSISFPIQVSLSPTALFTYLPNPPRTNTPVNFFNQSTGAVKYIWTFGDGDTIKTNNKNESIKHLYQRTKVFSACLQVFNAFGCIDTICQNVSARVNQLYDVPSAFSPNGDGSNDMIYVKGYGIKKISWNIYNRWGILMFTSNNISNGWDGKYKGELQPQDVYHYTLIVDFWNDKQDSKTGDITLLR